MLLGPVLNKMFGKAFIKNLPDSNIRRKHIIEQCNSINLEYEITEAVDGTKCVSTDFTIQHGQFFLTYPTSAGYYGNQLTNIKQLENIIDLNLPSCILLDDDCSFEHTIKLSENCLNLFENSLPDDWDIIILGSITGHELLETDNLTYFKVPHHNYAAGSHGIVMRNTVYYDFLRTAKEMKHWGDGIVGKQIDDKKNVYLVEPSVCVQKKPWFSDINKTIL
jgi:GR25 family glycosyltransferase involved in LPS biosynthesis